MKVFEIYIRLPNEHTRHIVLAESKEAAMSFMQFVKMDNTEITEIERVPLLVSKQVIKVNTRNIMKKLDEGTDVSLEIPRELYLLFRDKFMEEYEKPCEVDMFSRKLIFDNGAELRFIF